MSDEKPGRLARLTALGSLTGRVAAKYVREQVSSVVQGTKLGREALDRVHVDSARDVVEVMSRLKGAAMKVGQQVAMFADTMDLPEEVGQVFGKLHATAEPIPFPTIQEDVERELGRKLGDAFLWFDPKPLGTASLAQAHAARLPDGREVVVKVLHRGVGDSVATDLMMLKGALLSTRVVRRSKAEMDDIFDEIRARLEEELDYFHEAANLVAYAEIYGDDPRLRIPTVHNELSTHRVLVLDRLPGMPLETFLETATPEARRRAGETLVRFYYEQVFRHRMLHADPHPGNYLFEADGRVGVLDFGCVKRFETFWIATYARAALATIAGDRAAALAACVDLGAWDGKDPAAGEALWGFLHAIGGAYGQGVVQLGAEHENHLELMRPAIKAVIPFPEVRAPRDVIMLHRSLGGLYALSRRLHTRMDFGAVLRELAGEAVDRVASL
jgi:predicted unusual protein kinase regulating ubiquinone biosynthesis (AarF/ABC1/UbiB family)